MGNLSTIRDLLFQQDTLDLIFQKFGLQNNNSLIPWGNGFALMDQIGNISNFIDVDSNNNLIFQNATHSAIDKVSSVSSGQYQLYNHDHLIGTLFEYPDHVHTGQDFFMNLDTYDITDIVGQVTDIHADVASSLLDMDNLFDLF